MTTPLLPNTDLVAVAWLKRNAKFTAKGVGVATTIPDDLPQLRAGFLHVVRVGGSPSIDLPVRAPVVQVSAYAAPAEGSSKMPWAQASQLAEWVWEQTFSAADQNVTLAFSVAGYAQARVMTAVALSEPLRVENDPSGYARVDIEVLINWTGV